MREGINQSGLCWLRIKFDDSIHSFIHSMDTNKKCPWRTQLRVTASRVLVSQFNLGHE